jgi:hypothetical protein
LVRERRTVVDEVVVAMGVTIQIVFFIETDSFIEEKVVAGGIIGILGIVELGFLKGRIEVLPRVICLYLQLFFFLVKSLSL